MRKSKGFKWIWTAVCGICLLASGLLDFFADQKGLLMADDLAGERYETEALSYAQESVYYSAAGGLEEESIREIRNAVMKKLYEDSYITAEDPFHGWYDAYMGQSMLELRKDTATIQVNCIGVGGNYFDMHPTALKGGTYLDENNTDAYGMILDEYVAWTLFGSPNVAGMKLWVGDTVFTVYGVVAVPENQTFRNAYGNYYSVYIPFSTLKKLDENARITSYQTVLPNPIKGYAKNLTAEACGLQQLSDLERASNRSELEFGDQVLVENTDRYSLFSLFGNRKKEKYVTMRTNTVVYPFFENVARYTEQRLYRVRMIALLFLVLPFLTLMVLLVKLYQSLTPKKVGLFLSWPFRKVFHWVERCFEKDAAADAAAGGEADRDPGAEAGPYEETEIYGEADTTPGDEAGFFAETETNPDEETGLYDEAEKKPGAEAETYGEADGYGDADA